MHLLSSILYCTPLLNEYCWLMFPNLWQRSKPKARLIQWLSSTLITMFHESESKLSYYELNISTYTNNSGYIIGAWELGLKE